MVNCKCFQLSQLENYVTLEHVLLLLNVDGHLGPSQQRTAKPVLMFFSKS